MATGGRPAVTCYAAVLLVAALLMSALGATGSARSPLPPPGLASYSLLSCSCSGTFRCVLANAMQPRLLWYDRCR